MWAKKDTQRNACSKSFLTEDVASYWWDKDTDQNSSARSLILLCGGVGSVWSTTAQTRVSNATAVTFSVKCFNPLKLYLLSGNISRKWFASYFVIYLRAFNKHWSPTVGLNLIAVTTLLPTCGLYRCWQRIFKKNTNSFYALEWLMSISLAILPEMFIQMGYFF